MKRLRAFVVAAGTSLLLSGVAQGGMYRYTDRNGAISFTNNVKSIPAEARKNAVLVSKDPERPKQASPPSASSPVAQPAPPEGSVREETPLPAAPPPVEKGGRPLTETVGVVAAFLILFVLAGRATARLGLQKGSRLVRALLTVALLTYLAVMHLDGMLHTLLKFKKEMTSIQKSEDRRTNATEEALRQVTGEAAERVQAK